jgi:uncharacterized protein YqgV (UPF0045/DUF77 family)
MNLFPSRGLSVYGFEIKVSKSDFMSEIRKPDKSADIQKFCDRWYIVAPEEAVDESLLPATWGWLQVTGEQIRVKKEAPTLTPEPLNRKFVAAVVRRAHEQEEADIEARVRLRMEAERKRDEERITREVEARSRKSQEAIKQLADLKAKIGTSSWDYLNNDDVAAAVKIVREAGVTSTYGGLRQVEKEMKRCADRLRKALDGAFGEQLEIEDST